MIPNILFLLGPSGSGKTELSLELAKRLKAEIVSSDSMLIYRGMDIGTAKPTRIERRRIPHHLMDLVSPRSNFSVYQYRQKALAAIRQILKRERTPLVVGGSGLYVLALWKGLSAHPGENPKIREKLMDRAEKKGLSFLYERLQKLDPVRAQEIHSNDQRRIVRALEIFEVSGKTPSEGHGERQSLADLGYSVRFFGIERERAELYERINERVKEMFRKGWVQEVRRLKKRGFSKTARQALGYREILKFLNERPRGEVVSPLPISLIQQKTRQFAKRQLTWFRREKEIEWIPWLKGEKAASVCDKIMQRVNHA